MCGLVGGWFEQPTDQLRASMRRANELLAHRGPDDAGCEELSGDHPGRLFLGHTRLAIIDLSSDGHQPMATADGRFCIVFNGEIYNYQELRDELTALGVNCTTQTDTEVLLKAWAQWGSDALPKLVGMFAFAVYDRLKSTLTLVRDPYGIKPLYYAQEDDRLVFGSEIPAMLPLLAQVPKPNLHAVYPYLVHGTYDRGEHSFFTGIKSLEPGTLGKFDLSSATLSEPTVWWRPSYLNRAQISFDEATDIVREKFLTSVRLHLRSDVRVGAALSGGIDSSAIVCAMRYLEPQMPIHTFSYIASGSEKNEERWVDIVNEHTGAIGHKVTAEPEDLIKDLDRMVQAQGEPFGTTSIYAQFRVFQLAREHGIVVTLDGQGADEALAGYLGYPGERLMSLVETGRLKTAIRFAREWGKPAGRSQALAWMHFVYRVLPKPLLSAARSILGRRSAPAWLNMAMIRSHGVAEREARPQKDSAAKGRRVVEHLAQSLQKIGLPALLRHGDRNSMHFSIESRVPFLTTALTDYLLSLPEHYLINEKGVTKSVFRRAMRGIVPDSILDRTDKIGFDPDDDQWRKYYLEQIQILGNDSNSFINTQAFLASRASQDTGSCWRLLNYLIWDRLYCSS